MLKFKSWTKLIISMALAQSAGLIGTVFTVSSIPTWYALLNKPSFSPPNWVFGPVWTILYTLIGVSMYLIWTNKKGSLKLFLFHLFLNAIWSPIFFGAKNLGLAFLVILIMDATLILIIKSFYKINRTAGLVLIPYLIWISFASILNFSIWRLNPSNTVKNIFAQDFTFKKASDDYIFTGDKYNHDLNDFNLKRDSYRKNPTLSLKEELRVSLYKFVETRNSYVKNYLTMLRLRVLESTGIEKGQKEDIYSKLDSEVLWYGSRTNNYKVSDSLEDILNKSKEEDSRFINNTQPVIYFTLLHISIGDVKNNTEAHLKIYNDLKSEADKLVKLGRADASLFDRWFKDIDQELNSIKGIEERTLNEVGKIIGADEYQRGGAYTKSIESLSPSKLSLLKLNGFINELENTINNKR